MAARNRFTGNPVTRRSLLVSGAALLAMPTILRPAQASTSDVIVIGAGMAGLSAARKLANAGKSVVVIEGRNRIGGRIHTDQSLGFNAELGANWIHGITGNPLIELANASGTQGVVFDYNDTALLSESGKPIDDGTRFTELSATFDQVMRSVSATCEGRPARGGLNAPLQSALNEYGLSGTDKTIMDVIVDQEFAGDYGVAPDQLNPCANEIGEAFPGNDLLVFNGFGRITNMLSRGLRVRLGEPVESIDWTESGVSVSTGQRRYDAATCICTVPLGVLKAGSIDFKNDLPDTHLEAISRIGFGNFAKVFVTFQNDAVLPKTSVAFAANERRIFRNLIGLSGIAGRPAVMAYCGGEDAVRAASMTDREIAQEISDSVALARRSASSRIADVLVSRWSEDPFAQGAYSYPGIATKAEDFAALAEPVDGCLYFAGEAASQYYGTVHGAHISGNQAAEKILAA